MRPRTRLLPDGRVWLRLADPGWDDPLDPGWAGRIGGRWNPPGTFPTLYLNADPVTARLRLEQMLEGFPTDVEDLADDAYVLVAATLPRNQRCAEALDVPGLAALGLPESYPVDGDGRRIPHATCQPVGARVRERGLRGVLCRSAATLDGRGTELAWFPATRRSAARPVWESPKELADWRDAASWGHLGLEEQPRLR